MDILQSLNLISLFDVISHVLEELEHQINTKKKEEMTDQELQFHYFKLHDFDNNNLLDGLEIVKALTHAHDEAGEQNCSFFFCFTSSIFVAASIVLPYMDVHACSVYQSSPAYECLLLTFYILPRFFIGLNNKPEK